MADWRFVANAFCPTGKGGGSDNSCGSATHRVLVREHKGLGVRSEGHYEFRPWSKAKPERGYWQLTHWRVRHRAEAGFGKWNRVHGNQKDDVAGFKLMLDEMPTVPSAE